MTELEKLESQIAAVRHRADDAHSIAQTALAMNRGLEAAHRVPMVIVQEWSALRQACSKEGISDPESVMGGKAGRATKRLAEARARIVNRLRGDGFTDNRIARVMLLDPATVSRIER